MAAFRYLLYFALLGVGLNLGLMTVFKWAAPPSEDIPRAAILAVIDQQLDSLLAHVPGSIVARVSRLHVKQELRFDGPDQPTWSTVTGRASADAPDGPGEFDQNRSMAGWILFMPDLLQNHCAFHNVAALTDAMKIRFRQTGRVALLLCPIFVEQRLIGALSVGWGDLARVGDPYSYVPLLQHAADSLARDVLAAAP